MEQKKILWIVAALGIFLLVIFLGTLLIYSPQNTSTPTVVSAADIHNDTWVNPQALVTSQNQVKPEVVTTDNETTTVPTEQQNNLVQTGDVTVISNGTTTVVTQDGVTTIDLTKIQNSETEQVSKAEPSVRPVATRLPASNQQPKVETSEKAPAPVVKPAQTKPAEPKKPVDQYWVQAASFVSKANADNARSALVKQKIPAEVFTHTDNDGVTFYRVRVGPYTTKSEAEYWNSLIKTVDNFADAKSYVTNASKPAQ